MDVKYEENVVVDTCQTSVDEHGISLFVDKFTTTPKKSGGIFYDKDTMLNRALITTALAAYVNSGKSCFTPVRCLDGIGVSGIMGLLWKKYITNVDICINESRPTVYEKIKDNMELNNLEVEVENEDTCVLLHKKTYNFISLDCFTDAAHYLDSAFRNLPKNGILAITTTNDAAFLAISPEIPMRNYGGYIIRTFYLKELAIRLFLAAAARAAARHNKGIHVLCSMACKASFTVILTVKQGPKHANKSVQNIRKLIHCSMCEDRKFYPLTNYYQEKQDLLLGCGCATRLPGKVLLELGPIWSGSIFNVQFLEAMKHYSKLFPWREKTSLLMEQLITEARCCLKNDTKLQCSQVETAKKPKIELEITLEPDEDPAPPFYFNLHHHSPKGPQLLPVDKVIQLLRSAGYRASRTHFDREAVRTNASLTNLTKIMKNAVHLE